jgi:hypothetical protein
LAIVAAAPSHLLTVHLPADTCPMWCQKATLLLVLQAAAAAGPAPSVEQLALLVATAQVAAALQLLAGAATWAENCVMR